MSLRAQTPNQKFKQNVQTQVTYGIQAFSVLYMTQLEALSQQYYISWDGRRLRALGHPRFL